MSPCRQALCRTVFVCLSVCLSHVSRLFAIPKFRTPVSVWRARKPTLRAVAPPGFCNRGEVRCGSIGGLEYEVPQSRLYCLYINVALCSTALQCICRVIRRSSMTIKAHTYYIMFGRPPIEGGSFPPSSPGGATGYSVNSLRK